MVDQPVCFSKGCRPNYIVFQLYLYISSKRFNAGANHFFTYQISETMQAVTVVAAGEMLGRLDLDHRVKFNKMKLGRLC